MFDLYPHPTALVALNPTVTEEEVAALASLTLLPFGNGEQATIHASRWEAEVELTSMLGALFEDEFDASWKPGMTLSKFLATRVDTQALVKCFLRFTEATEEHVEGWYIDLSPEKLPEAVEFYSFG